MYLGRVVGCVVSTMKDNNLTGQRLLNHDRRRQTFALAQDARQIGSL